MPIWVAIASTSWAAGASGPAARASGLEEDARATSPNLAYDGFVPAIQTRALGDVQGRLEQRHLELEQCFELLETLLDRPLEPSAAENGRTRRQLGAARVESPRGATLCVVERDGDRPVDEPSGHEGVCQLRERRRPIVPPEHL